MAGHKIAVAMSGGVDSAVTALLLLQRGFEVDGFYLDITNDISGRETVKTIASALDIRLHVVEVAEMFESTVVNWMVEEYSTGRIPNPCIHCNKTIKWDFLGKAAKALGFNDFATGHYARVYRKTNGRPVLFMGKDKMKDQSYFLSYLTVEDLSRTTLPLGDLTKMEVRRLAEDHRLPNFNKSESQDLCFLREDNINNFLNKRAISTTMPGKIVDNNGNVLGEHKGLIYYTIGQRKGLGIAAKFPLYVLKKDFLSNCLVVGYRDETVSEGLIAKKINWLEEIDMEKPFYAEVKIRYRSNPTRACIEYLDEDTIKISFDHQVRDVTPGQIAVLYNGEQVIGAGTISENIR